MTAALKDALAALRALFDNTLDADTAINWRGLRHEGRDQPRQGFQSSVDAFVADPALVTLNRGGWSIYFGVAPRRNRDGTKAGCAGISALWVDLDAKDFAAERLTGKARIREELSRRIASPLLPSVLI